MLSFDSAVSLVRDGLVGLFAPFSYGAHLAGAYFPAEYRNPILQAGSELTLLRVTYDGITRVVEPYSLVFKQRKDGVAQEYFYGYDQTGGHSSGPGIKAFLQGGMQRIENSDAVFEPRYSVELGKAGDRDNIGYFARPFGVSRPCRPGVRRKRARPVGATNKVQCSYCGKTFMRKSPTTRLNEHKDRYGNRCYARIGIRVF